MKRLISILLALALGLGTLGAQATENQDYVTIAQLREQTQDGWTQTYQAHGRTITVDVDITVPKVESCPVLTVRQAPMPDEALLADYDIRPSAPSIGYLYAQMGGLPDTGAGRTHLREIAQAPGEPVPNAQDNPMSCDEALAFLAGEVERMTGTSIGTDWRIRWAKAYECLQHYQIKNGEVVWGEPATAMGEYGLEGDQLLYGIPLRNGPDYTKYPSAASPMRTTLGAGITDKEHYVLILQRVLEDSVKQADVPLLSFDGVRAKVEQLIESGLLREVDSVELCYTTFLDPSDEALNDVLPVWCIHGVYADSAMREYQGVVYDEFGDAVDDRIALDLYFSAQTGEFLNPDNASSNRRDVPDILTWDSVQ